MKEALEKPVTGESSWSRAGEPPNLAPSHSLEPRGEAGFCETAV